MKIKAPFHIHITSVARQVRVSSFGLVSTTGGWRWRYWCREQNPINRGGYIGKVSRQLTRRERSQLDVVAGKGGKG